MKIEIKETKTSHELVVEGISEKDGSKIDYSTRFMYYTALREENGGVFQRFENEVLFQEYLDKVIFTIEAFNKIKDDNTHYRLMLDGEVIVQ